ASRTLLAGRLAPLETAPGAYVFVRALPGRRLARRVLAAQDLAVAVRALPALLPSIRCGHADGPGGLDPAHDAGARLFAAQARPAGLALRRIRRARAPGSRRRRV